MESGDVIQLIVIVILLALSAFFSSAETALTTCNKIRIQALAEEGNKSARRLEQIFKNQEKMLSAILIGNNIVNLSSSSLATILATKVFGNSGAGIATGILTIAVLIFGEITPKTLATTYAEKLALIYSGPIQFLITVCTPVIFIINHLSRGLMRILHIDPNKKPTAITESEFLTIVEVSHEEGVIESEERQMITNVVDFGDAQAKDVMIPRIDMVFAQVDMTYEEIIDIFRENYYTRLPVYEENTDNIIGILNMKDLLLHKAGTPFSLRSYLREPEFTYEYKNTSELLDEMREHNSTMVIVLDEYGATAGLLTLEDLLEEIVGEIRDEYDGDEEERVLLVKEGEYLIEGGIQLNDLNDELDLGLESEEYDSLGGFIIEKLDHLPEEGEQVETEDLILTVDRVEKKRIDKVRLQMKKKPEEI